MRIVGAFHDGRESRDFQRCRISLTSRGRSKNLRSDLGPSGTLSTRTIHDNLSSVESTAMPLVRQQGT
jgi:hypothetical protein